eukprot:scaffold44064_cov70-Phaeocystis_antarctica.AAC.7
MRLKATEAIAPSITHGQASENTAHSEKPRPGKRGACCRMGSTMAVSGGTTSHEATLPPSERHACCRMSSAMAGWLWISAHHRAVRPSLSSSSVLALARSRAFTHASCPPAAASIRAVWPSMSCSSRLALARSSTCTHASCPCPAAIIRAEAQDGCVAVAHSFHERGVAEAAWQVDARAALQQHPHHLQLALGCSGVQQG